MLEFWIHFVAYQLINVNATQPCFFNYTAGIDMFQNCGGGHDWLTMTLMPWQWVTGGNFTMILVSIIVLTTYIKYQKVVYPLIIGIIFLPVSYAFFPTSILNFAIIAGFLGVGMIIAYILVSQTNET